MAPLPYYFRLRGVGADLTPLGEIGLMEEKNVEVEETGEEDEERRRRNWRGRTGRHVQSTEVSTRCPPGPKNQLRSTR